MVPLSFILTGFFPAAEKEKGRIAATDGIVRNSSLSYFWSHLPVSYHC